MRIFRRKRRYFNNGQRVDDPWRCPNCEEAGEYDPELIVER